MHNKKWHKHFQVHLYHIDSRKKLALPSLCNFFQEIAAEHAEQLDFGFDSLNSKGVFWVLSRLQVQIHKYPLWGEEITISTWPRGVDGMFALRDYEVLSSENERLAVATSAWLILDKEKHRPQRISENDILRSFNGSEYVLNLLPEKVMLPEKLSQTDKFKAAFSDIDLNQHVNNVKYVEWAVDALPADILLNKDIVSFCVNFMGEAGLGDLVNLWSSQDSEEFFISIRNETTGRELSRIRMRT